MFTENEVALILNNERVKDQVAVIKKDFVTTEAPYLEISDHDFLSLILLSPMVGIALANGKVGLFEELALNKKARKLSKGGYFMKKDPVVIAMGYLIKHYDTWEVKFIDVIKIIIEEMIDIITIKEINLSQSDHSAENFRREVIKAPYGFIRLLSSFFCADDDELINAEGRNISRVEFDKIKELGEKMGMNAIPIYRHFIATYQVK